MQRRHDQKVPVQQSKLGNSRMSSRGKRESCNKSILKRARRHHNTAHWTEAKIKAKQFPHNIDHTAGTPLKPVQMRNDTGENQLLHGDTHLELELKG